MSFDYVTKYSCMFQSSAQEPEVEKKTFPKVCSPASTPQAILSEVKPLSLSLDFVNLKYIFKGPFIRMNF